MPAPFLQDTMQLDSGPDAPAWTREIPVSVNDTYGDPFIPEQVGNTVVKLGSLQSHRAPIAIFTKAGYDEQVLHELATVPARDNVVVFYSLTGLDEGGISFASRVAFIAALRVLFPNTVIFTRPIIRGLNDDPATLRRLSTVARDHTGLLVLGGLHDAHKRKHIDSRVEDLLISYCDRMSVKTFYKTACAAAWMYDRRCWVHELGQPRSLEIVAALGYRFEVIGDTVFLDRATTGDINLIRMLAGCEVYVRDLISNYNLLTMPVGARKLEMTSSWFAWAENIETCLDCSYCIIKQIEYLKRNRVRIGVHPTHLPDIVAPADTPENFPEFRKTKLSRSGARPHMYADVRVAKPCRLGMYPKHARPFAARQTA